MRRNGISMEFPEPRIVDAGGVNLAVYEVGAGTPVVLLHGWPEIAYCWANQMASIAAAGFRAIAVDLKGFGLSDAPTDKALYDSQHMCADFAALLDALEIDAAVFCGHDWGGSLVWPMAQMHPDRVRGAIGVCTPHRPPPPVPPLQILRKRFTDIHYFVQFQEAGAPERAFEGREEKFFPLMFRRPPGPAEIAKYGVRLFDLPGRIVNGPEARPEDVIVPREVIDRYVAAYRKSGFTGGINLYRNIDRNYEIALRLDPIIRTPALWIGAEKDVFLPPEGADKMAALVPDLEKHVIPDCGHWVTWEKPAALNGLLVDWLTRRMR